NQFSDKYSKFDLLIGVGVKTEVTAKVGAAFEELEKFRDQNPGWVSGFLTYDLKNEIEDLTSGNIDGLQFPELYFFAPEHLIVLKGNEAEIISDNPQQVFEEINSQTPVQNSQANFVQLKSR